MFAVNVINIAVGMSHNFGVGEVNQFMTGTESKSLVGADFHAGGKVALIEMSFGAEGTFSYHRVEGVIVFICRNLERTGDDAITTTDTFPGIICNGTLGGFLQGSDNTGGGASRFIAVHTLDFDGKRFVVFFGSLVFVDYRISCF